MVKRMDEIRNSFESLVKQYETNPHAILTLKRHIENVFPQILDEAINREQRKQTLTSESDNFVCRFLAKHRAFYCAHIDTFYAYDGIHFTPLREDELIYSILTAITPLSPLHPWKYRTKVATLSAIKRRSPLTVIPESDTIQHVIEMFHPSIFSTRNHAKYFLSVLGDHIHDNSSKRIYLASPSLKEVVRRLAHQMSELFGVHGALQSIKFKYYEHSYANIRLLFIDNTRKQIQVPQSLNRCAMDILCVASHYSKRYGDADGFLTQCADSQLTSHALYVKDRKIETIVDDFIGQCIQPCNNATIQPKNMLFLWKQYLSELNIPNIIFHDPLIFLCKERIKYDASIDAFVDITSPLLPAVAIFIEFWGMHMIDEDEHELEISEVVLLLKRHAKNASIEAPFLIELIRHFYPDTMVDDDKYIIGVRCMLWDKKQTVIDHLEIFCATSYQGSTLYDAYACYSENLKGKLGVSKRYYEKVAWETMGEKIDDFGVFNGYHY